MIFWFSFLGVFALAALLLPSRGPETPSGRAALLLGAVVMGAFGIGLKKFGAWLGHAEQDAIVEFLKTTLEAKETA